MKGHKMKSLTPVAILLLLCTAAAALAYAWHVDQVVAQRFQGRLWELPAKVYARPLSLYQGLALSPEAFERELGLLGYRPVHNDPVLPGTYTRHPRHFTLLCRPFDFGDEQRPLRRTRVWFKNGRIVEVRGPGGNEDERLDPALVGQFYPSSMEDRILLDVSQTPELLKKTIIAVEDKTFYTHFGIDLVSVLRATAVNLRQGRFSQGASTLTQQLAKNFFLTPEKTIRRKVSEAVTAIAIEHRFTKDQILEAYMNEVYLGQDGTRAIHGFGLAAEFYFGKPTGLLAPHETALLVGMLKGPSAYNPRRHPIRARDRRNTVLRLMADQALISGAALQAALNRSLGVIPAPTHSPFPFYLDLVKRRLLEEYREQDLKTMGLRIFTPLDPQVQTAAEKGVAEFMAQRGAELEAGVVVAARASNEIQALVGGKQARFSGFNRALDARRPIGSLVKPAVFLTALERPDAYTLATRISDAPVALRNPDGSLWKPRNFDRKFHGEIPLYKSLVHSYNTSTVRLGTTLGLDAVANALGRLGYALDSPLKPAMLLGSVEMSPAQVAQVYHTLASGGFYTPARAIRAVYTPEGQELRRYPLTVEQRVAPGPAFLVNTVLQAVVREGTGKSLARWMDPDLGTAGKTGTTNDLRDAWFAGFSGSRLAVVWIGRDDNRPTGLTGATGALQVFGRIMAGLPGTPLILAPPEEIEWGVIDPDTGRPAHPADPGALAVPFIRGSAPAPTGNTDRSRPTGTGPGNARGNNNKKPRYLIDWLKDVFK